MHSTTNSEMAATPRGTGAAKGTTNAGTIPQPAANGQGASRTDFFAAAALQGMIARCSDGLAVFRLCVENASATANTAFFIAREMENYATRNEPPRRKRKGGAR